MSAFIVSHKHINTILTYANGQRFSPKVRLTDGTLLSFDQLGDLQHAAEILIGENVASINARYPDTIGNMQAAPGLTAEMDQPIIFTFERKAYKAVEMISICSCYNYQACETADYDSSDAHKIVNAIRECAISNLPGMQDAPWSID